MTTGRYTVSVSIKVGSLSKVRILFVYPFTCQHSVKFSTLLTWLVTNLEKFQNSQFKILLPNFRLTSSVLPPLLKIRFLSPVRFSPSVCRSILVP